MTDTIKADAVRAARGKRAGDRLVSGDTLLDALASPALSELFAALTDLVADGTIRVSEALDVYVRAGWRRNELRAGGETVESARAAVLDALDGLVVHYINIIGQVRTKKTESDGIRAHQCFSDRLDDLIAACRREAPVVTRPPSQWSARVLERLRSDLADTTRGRSATRGGK
jgi:hypothetical protein